MENGSAGRPLLNIRGLSKSFPGVKALDGVDLTVSAGQIHALLGENGAGKSTLIKILSGAHKKDAGELRFNGKSVDIHGPRDSKNLGIETIYQEFNLSPNLTIAENIFLGRLPGKRGMVDWRMLRDGARRILDSLGARFDVDARISSLTVAQQQLVEIAKALNRNVRLLIMDEPSAVIGDDDLKKLFEIVRNLSNRGVSVIYISHRIKEIFELAHVVSVLKDGRYIGTYPVGTVTEHELISRMVGRSFENVFPQSEPAVSGSDSRPLLEVDRVCREPVVHPVSFTIRSGEILGIAGLVGAGRTELVRLLFGADRLTGGSMKLNGRPFDPRDPRAAIARHIGLVTEDRKRQGLFLQHSVRLNVTISSLRMLSKFFVMLLRNERRLVGEMIEAMRIKTPDQLFQVGNMSGGNQQKVILSRWLCRDVQILILDEPTRGIDVGSKREIYDIMLKLKEQGKGIVMISSELPEILGMSDRILVMHQGSLVKEFSREEASEEKITAYAVGRGSL